MSSKFVEHGARAAASKSTQGHTRRKGSDDEDGDDSDSPCGSVAGSADGSVHASDREFVAESEDDGDSDGTDPVAARVAAEEAMRARDAARAAPRGGVIAAAASTAKAQASRLPTLPTARVLPPTASVPTASAFDAMTAAAPKPRAPSWALPARPPTTVKPAPPPRPPIAAPATVPAAVAAPLKRPPAALHAAPAAAKRAKSEDEEEDGAAASKASDASDSDASDSADDDAGARNIASGGRARKSISGGRAQRFIHKSAAAPPPPPPNFFSAAAPAPRHSALPKYVRARIVVPNAGALLRFLKPLRGVPALTILLHDSPDFTGMKFAMVSDKHNYAVRSRYGCAVEGGWRADGGARLSANELNGIVFVLPLGRLLTMLDCVCKASKSDPLVLTLLHESSPTNGGRAGKRARLSLSRDSDARDFESTCTVPLPQEDDDMATEEQFAALEATTSVHMEVACDVLNDSLIKPATALKVDRIRMELFQAVQGELTHSRLVLSFEDTDGADGTTTIYGTERKAAAAATSRGSADDGADADTAMAVQNEEPLAPGPERDALPWVHVYSMVFAVKDIKPIVSGEDGARSCTMHIPTAANGQGATVLVLDKVYGPDISQTVFIVGMEED